MEVGCKGPRRQWRRFGEKKKEDHEIHDAASKGSEARRVGGEQAQARAHRAKAR